MGTITNPQLSTEMRPQHTQLKTHLRECDTTTERFEAAYRLLAERGQGGEGGKGASVERVRGGKGG
jgi:hypothetical protein